MRRASALALLLAALAVGCGGEGSERAGPIRIGSVLSITGGAAFLGDPMLKSCLLYTSPSPRDGLLSRMPSSA